MQGGVDEADWVAVSALASLRNVSRQAISKRVAKLREGGRLPTRGEGRSLRVHRPTFDELAAQAHDPAQDLRNRHVKRAEAPAEAVAEEPPKAQAPREPSQFDSAAAREKNAKAELAEMRLAQQRGELIPAREIERAAIEAGTAIAQAVAAIKSQSGKLYAASKGGEEALHIELVGLVNGAIAAIGDSMAKLAARGASDAE